MNQFVKVTRRELLLGWGAFPVLLLVTPLMVWCTHHVLFMESIRVWEGAPVLRIYWGALALPFLVIFLMALVGALIYRATDPESEIIFRHTSKIMMVTLAYMAFPSFILSPILTQLFQRYHLPEHGYTKCNLLQGNPAYHFSDWVKNPAWCVRGKDREWVFEQARLAQEGEATNPDKGATK